MLFCPLKKVPLLKELFFACIIHVGAIKLPNSSSVELFLRSSQIES